MDARAQRIMRAGERTRFQPGNKLAVGHGRPRTGRLKEQFRKVANRWGGHGFISKGEQFGEYVLAEALRGDKDARELFCRVLGPEIGKQWLDIAKNALETGQLRMRQSPRKVRVPRQTVKNSTNDLKDTHFAHIEGVPQEFQPIPPATVHETARALMGIEADRAPARPKRAVKVELW